MMRKSILTIPLLLLLLFAAIGAPAAHADSLTLGTLNFTVTGGGPNATSGSFVYDNTTSLFTSFNVEWAGTNWDFEPSLLSLGTVASKGFFDGLPSISAPLPWFGFWQPVTELTTGFQLNDSSQNIKVGTFFDDVLAGGTYYTTETSATPTPEPSTFGLMLIGLGLGAMVVMRKRYAR